MSAERLYNTCEDMRDAKLPSVLTSPDLNMRNRNGLKLCFCELYGCNGTPLGWQEWELHQKASREPALRQLQSKMDQITLSDPQPSGIGPLQAVRPMSPSPENAPSSDMAMAGKIHQHSSPPNTKVEETYNQLFKLDTLMSEHIQSITEVLREWSHSGRITTRLEYPSRFITRKEAEHYLDMELSWLHDTSMRVKSAKTYGDKGCSYLQKCVVDRAAITCNAILEGKKLWDKRGVNDLVLLTSFDTGKYLKCGRTDHRMI